MDKDEAFVERVEVSGGSATRTGNGTLVVVAVCVCVCVGIEGMCECT